MVLKKFEKYIVSYVLAGSLVQGEFQLGLEAVEVHLIQVSPDVTIDLAVQAIEAAKLVRVYVYADAQPPGPAAYNRVDVQAIAPLSAVVADRARSGAGIRAGLRLVHLDIVPWNLLKIRRDGIADVL